MPTVFKKARARRERASGPFACLPFRPHGKTRGRWSAPLHKNKKEFRHVHDLFPLRLPHGLCPLTEGQLADMAALHQC